VRDAVEKTGKNKASSVDGIMDVIFQRKTWGRTRIDGWHPYMENPDPETSVIERHKQEVESRLVLNLMCYYNKILDTEECLPFNQNCIE
jgi:hypothetical protein